MEQSSRTRAPNFTSEEQLLFYKVLEPYTAILESKKTDGIKLAAKQEAWANVAKLYNANTKHVPRTVDNLISCYRNLKAKMKKQHSKAKMDLEDSSQKQELLIAMESHGKDWQEVGKAINKPAEVCETIFTGLTKEYIKNENQHKKKVMGTGGGPPPSDDDPLENIKKFIEPQMDGMFTIYDGDSVLMKQFQESRPQSQRIQPIENAFKNNICEVEVEVHTTPETQATPQHKVNLITNINRTDILRKKKSSALIYDDKTEGPPLKKQKNANDSFINLAQQKLELVKLQKMSLEQDIAHKKKIYELELENAIKQNKHMEEMREKELMLINLKLKYFTSNEEKM